MILWPSHPEERAERLRRALSPTWWPLLRRVIREAESRHLPLYLVGGFVRDLLLGQVNQDFDLVVEGDAIALARALAARYGGRVTVHKRFGTACWQTADASIHLDFASARSETYAHPGALPTVAPGTLADDLRRRDFTINALAIRLDGEHLGELRDDLGGLDDLQQGRIRALHPLSYQDDPTRILRAVRYEQRYAFSITVEDLAHIAEAKIGLRALSGERLRHELDLILMETHAADMLARLDSLGILLEIHPALFWDEALRPALTRLSVAGLPATWGIPLWRGIPAQRALGYLLWLGQRPEAEIRAMATRLDFPAPLREAMLSLSALHQDLPSLTPARPSVLASRFDLVPPLALYALLVQFQSREDPSASQKYLTTAIEHYLTTWRHVRPRTSGHTLQKLGIPPGPIYQVILQRLRAAWLDGEIHSPAEEKDLLRTILHESQGDFSHGPAPLP